MKFTHTANVTKHIDGKVTPMFACYHTNMRAALECPHAKKYMERHNNADNVFSVQSI